MKKLFLALALILAAQSAVKASHVLGGEIRWDCLPNGRFVFYAKVFRDCSGIPYNFGPANLEIIGNPLPRTATNGTMTGIALLPDSNEWIQNNFGDTSPECRPGGPRINCSSSDEGAVQQFFFKSNPLVMNGVPPTNGWRFVFTQPCCRPNDVANLAAGGTMILRAVMYRDANNSNVNPCKDSSPEFLALPANSLCRGYEFTYNHTAIDRDLDSLVYSWDRTYNAPAVAPQPVPFAPGFSQNNPTPDKTANTLNVPATMDPLTGQIKMGVWSGGPQARNYLTVVRVDAYRAGQVIASVFREIPFSFFDCPRLQGAGNGQINRPPEIFIDGDSAEGIVVDIVAGQTVNIPFQAVDQDLTSGLPPLQLITVVPDGYMFSRDLRDTKNCYYRVADPNDTLSCAILRNQTPTRNQNVSPPRNEISGYAGIATEFIWTTKCHHISTYTGLPGTNQGIYNFVMRTFDDFCPIPGINYPTITVRVRDPLPIQQPIMKGVSINLDGSVTYQWTPPIDTASTFFKYLVEFSQPNDGFPPTAYQDLNTNEKKYQQERRSNGLRVYIPRASNINELNVLRQVPNKDYYVRMQSISGCTDDVPSVWSQPARVMELDLTPSGETPQEPLRSEMTINWNAPKAANAPSHPYFIYESRTRYYVYTNDNFTINANETYPGLDDPNNWLLRGNTYSNTFEVGSSTCSGNVAFRVEARDTVITYKQGTRPRLNAPPDPQWLDTLYFSTFSILDTAFMENPGFIPPPKLDTLEVLENGDIYVKIDAGAAGTTGEYRIYQDAILPHKFLGSVVKPNDSLVITQPSIPNAQVTPLDIVIEGIDECDTTTKSNSLVYQTFIPVHIQPLDQCDPDTLSWAEPTGFPTGVQGYRIYRRFKDTSMTNYTAWQLLKTVNTTKTSVNLFAYTDFEFKVVAFDAEDAVIISAATFIPVARKNTKEVVPAPELRCAYVEDDGSVTLSFIPAHPSINPAFDSTRNWKNYQFQYRIGSGNWTTFPAGAGVKQDTSSVTITGIDAIDNLYEFRAASISGCDGLTPSPYSTINLINPTVSAIPGDSNKRVSGSYTGSGIFSNTPEVLYKSWSVDLAADTGHFTFGFSIGSNQNSDPKSFIDSLNSTICDTIASYYITKMDQLTGCMNRSRPDTVRIIDQIPPPPQKIDYLTYVPVDAGRTLTFDINGIPTQYPAAEYKGDLLMEWTDKPSDDIDSLLIFAPELNTGQNVSINTVPWRKLNDTIFNTIYDASDSAYYFSAQSIDACGRRAQNFRDFDYHKNIDVDVEFSPCDSTMIISWNGYYYFHNDEEVEYSVQQLFTAEDGGVKYIAFASLELGITTDSVFLHKIDRDSVEYTYRVVAFTRSSNDAAASNWESVTSNFGAVPAYNYFTYATVRPSKAVELQLFKDTNIIVGGYTVIRGTDTSSLQAVNRLGANTGNSIVNFDDLSADTDGEAYFYQIIVENTCGNAIDTTNFASTIHLTVTPKNEALTNVLRWNEYRDWDSSVAYYNIYRGINGNSAQTLYATVPAGNGTVNQFIDDVYDNSYAAGDYCYKVEAVQGSINPDYASVLQPATSMSNEVCVVQKPLFYVPNAFAPDGVNKVFGPEGQFFDFTKYEMIIYNRWGEMIFETRDINEGWDGTIDGEIAPQGSYVYTIRFEDAEGEEHRRKGTVTLLK